MFTDAAIQTVSLQYELEQPGRIRKVMNAINALHLWQTFFPGLNQSWLNIYGPQWQPGATFCSATNLQFT